LKKRKKERNNTRTLEVDALLLAKSGARRLNLGREGALNILRCPRVCCGLASAGRERMGARTTRTGDERDALDERLALSEILHRPKRKDEMVRNSGEGFLQKWSSGIIISRATYSGDIRRARFNLPFLCAAVRETGQDVLRVQAVERGHCKGEKKECTGPGVIAVARWSG
jgi:hypothetical protein